MFNETLSDGAVEKIASKPIRWSIATVAIALISSLALSTIIGNVSNLQGIYNEIIAQQAALVLVSQKPTQASISAAKDLAPQESNRIIVKYKEKDLPPGLAIAAERANLEKAQGLKELLTISGIGAVVYQVGEDDTAAEVVGRLLNQKKELIEYAEVDMLVAPVFVPNDPNVATSWYINKIAAPTAWDSAQGEGIIIAIADSGIDCTHPDLAVGCVPGWNTASNNSNTTDLTGHGTRVAGVARQLGNNAIGSAGTAYKAQSMQMRVSDDPAGIAYYSALAAAATYAADNGARVVNMSYSGVCASASIASAANYMRSKGGVAVLAAGNSGTVLDYTNSSSLTCVSATDVNDARTSWSSFGNYVDVSAPGAGMYTTSNGGGYASVSGTSFSAPLTAGIYALMFSANPALTPTQADNILFSTADDLGTAGWDQYYGHGRVNAAKAVAAALATKGTQDTVAPTIPTKLVTSNVTSNSVLLSWAPSTDDNSGVVGYTIYRNGTKLTTVAGTSYSSTNLTSQTAYTYTVRAEDGAGNQSGDSVSVSISTSAVEFGISSFSVPTKTASSANVSVALTKPGTITIKYGTSNTNLNLSVQSATTSISHAASLSGLTAATTYYYQVVATDGTAILTSLISSFKTNKATGGGKPVR